MEPGLIAGVRRNFGESYYHMYQKSLRKFELFYYPLCFTRAHYHYSYMDGFRVVFLGEIYCKVEVVNLKNVWYF